MSTKTAITTSLAARLGTVNVRLQGMYDEHHIDPVMAIELFTDSVCGLSIEFHASTAQFRDFAAALIEHADITEAMQAKEVTE